MFKKSLIKTISIISMATMATMATLLTTPVLASTKEVNCCGHNYHDWSIESTDGMTDHMVCYQCMEKDTRLHFHNWEERESENGATILQCTTCGMSDVVEEVETPAIDALIRHKDSLPYFMKEYSELHETETYMGKVHALSEFIGVEPEQLLEEKATLEEKIRLLSDYLDKH